MKVMFICAPYTAKTDNERHENIENARRAAIHWWRSDWAVICPPMNSAWMSGAAGEGIFYMGYEEIVRRCDAIALCLGWREHKGCRQELIVATGLDLPVFLEQLDHTFIQDGHRDVPMLDKETTI